MSCGFHHTLRSRLPALLPLALHTVHATATRLDAIGAIGIARCFTFGGAFKRVLHNPAVPPRLNLTKEQYMQQGHQATTFNHFAEKLLKIKVGGRATAIL
jgi:HD superfamily phosphodiesterase